MKAWYVAHTHAKAERQALGHLERQEFTAYLPQYLKRRRHARRAEWVPAPLFPRYLFVNMDIERDRWRAVRSTVGVRHVISNGDRPIPVADQIVEEIRAREDETGMVAVNPERLFSPGEMVRVTSGALADQVGLFDCISDDERVFILFELLGRQVRVRVPMESVAAYL